MARINNKFFQRAPIQGGTKTIGLTSLDNFFDDMQTLLGVDFEKEVEKAVFSTTYFTQQQMKKEWLSYTSGLGQSPSELQKKRWFDIANSKGASKTERTNYGGLFNRSAGLGKAFFYKKFQGQGKAVLGWLGQKAAAAGRIWQEGTTRTVDAAYRSKLIAASKLAGDQWPYFVMRNGKRYNIIPKVGKTYQIKRGGFKTDYFGHFFKKYEVPIQNTLRRKIEEKMKIVPRGSHENAINADFESAVNGVAVAAYQQSAAVLEAVLLKNLGHLA